MIFVDRPLWRAHGRRFAHLISDTSFDELHGFAADLGMPFRAFHRDHYDIPDHLWETAVDLGAIPVDPRELARRLRASGLRVRPSQRRSSQHRRVRR